MVAMRTKQLADQVARDGFDEFEAKAGAVAVMSNPAVAGHLTFQAQFERQIGMGPDMARRRSRSPWGAVAQPLELRPPEHTRFDVRAQLRPVRTFDDRSGIYALSGP